MDEEQIQQQQQENQKQESKHSAVDKVNSLYNNVRAARQIFVWGKRASYAIRAIPLFANPVFWIVVAIIIFVIIFLFFGRPIMDKPKPVPEEKIEIGKLVDKTQASVGEELQYTINVIYNKNKGVTVRDPIPDGTIAVSAFPKADIIEKDPEGKIIAYVWKFSDPDLRVLTDGNGNKTYPNIKVKVKAIQDNTAIINKASAMVTEDTPSGGPGSGAIDTKSSTLRQYLIEVPQKYSIPFALLKAIARIESGVLTYTQDEVHQFGQTNWWTPYPGDAPSLEQLHPLISRGYAYNTCAFPKSKPACPGQNVMGVMQFEIRTWNNFVSQLQFSDHATDRRYIKDSIYGTGAFLDRMVRNYPSIFTKNSSDWTEAQVKATARTYCGGNPIDNIEGEAACGNYESDLWKYYQEYRASVSN